MEEFDWLIAIWFFQYFSAKNFIDPSLTLRIIFSQSEKMKGGDPAARSRTATLLRLSANHEIHRGPINRASGASHFQRWTGGVYKARERIHGAVADAPLLAIPTS